MVGRQRHAPVALPPEKSRYPLYRKLGGLQDRSGWERKISPPPGFDPRTVQPVASRYTDYALTAHVTDEVTVLKFRYKCSALTQSLQQNPQTNIRQSSTMVTYKQISCQPAALLDLCTKAQVLSEVHSAAWTAGSSKLQSTAIQYYAIQYITQSLVTNN